ncbi:MAG: response regulator [Ramlibacter sp.]|nr:response regulator [Ramlibacter sp.]
MKLRIAAAAKIPRVLVVDDMPDNLFLMNGLFEDRFQVLQASSGREALEIVMSRNPPDMVLLDIMMPDMDGYEVLRRIRQHAPTAHIPVIFLTALASKQDTTLGLTLGAADYLTKPIDPELVLRRVEGHMRQATHARRIEALSEKLARRLQPEAWQRLFHSGEVEKIRFEEKGLTTLYIEPVDPVRLQPMDHDALIAEVEWLAAQHEGVHDRFFDAAAVVFFEDPSNALRMALELHRAAGEVGLRMGIGTGICEIGFFRHDSIENITLIGTETRYAARMARHAASGSIAISPETCEVVKDELRAELSNCIVAREFDQDEDISLVCVTPPLMRVPQAQSKFAGAGLSAH